MKHELTYTWPELKGVQDRMAEIERLTGEMSDTCSRERRSMTEPERLTYNALWRERHELDDKCEDMRKHCIPEVGMPCTVIWYSDRSGGYVAEVVGPKKKEVIVKCDGLYHCTKVFTYRTNGHWVEKGTTSRDWGTLLHLGYKSDYYDPSF